MKTLITAKIISRGHEYKQDLFVYNDHMMGGCSWITYEQRGAFISTK